MRKVCKPSSREHGQSMTELAVSLVFVLVILAGVVDVGRALFTYIALRDAAQEGAVFGSVQPTWCSQIEARTRSTSTTPVDLSSGDVQVTTTIDGGSCGSATPSQACLGNEIRVTVQYANFPLIMPFLGAMIGRQTVPISASVADSILTPPCP